MNRSKKLYLLLGILLVACIATFGLTQWEDKKEKIKNSEQVILELPAESVQALSWEYDSTSLSFHREDTWLYDEDAAFPIDEEKMDDLLACFEALGTSFTIEDVEDYGQYGLERPTCTIRVDTEDASYEILLGDYSTMDAQRYVSIGDGNVYLMKRDLLDTFDVALSDLIDQDETPDMDTATSIQFSGAETQSIVYNENGGNTYRDEDVYFISKAGAELPLDTTLVDSYLQTLCSLNLTDYVTYNATEDELSTYGLDDPDMTITVQYTTSSGEDDTFVLHISQDPAQKSAVAEMEEDEDIKAYARVGESKILYEISSGAYLTLMDASYDSLRHKEVLPLDFDDIQQIDITLDGADYTITAQTDSDKTTYLYQEEELTVTDLKAALQALSADQFTTQTPTEKKEISLTLYPALEDSAAIQIDLYRYDGSNCLAVVDGTPVCLVARSAVVNLIEAVNAIVL